MIGRNSVRSDPVRIIAPVPTNQLTLRSIAIAYESGANIHGISRNRTPGSAIHD